MILTCTLLILLFLLLIKLCFGIWIIILFFFDSQFTLQFYEQNWIKVWLRFLFLETDVAKYFGYTNFNRHNLPPLLPFLKYYKLQLLIAITTVGATGAMHRGPSTRGPSIATFYCKIFSLKAQVNLIKCRTLSLVLIYI